ncbi:MAG: glycosyltransferase family 9 protein [Candidatus Omnitrophota bacterium]
MKLSFMRDIDDNLGVVICKFLWLIVKIKGLFIPSRRDADPRAVKMILCQKYFGMGTILHAIPLIKGLRNHYPNAKIIFMTLKEQESVVRVCNLADEVLTIRLNNIFIFIKDVITNLSYLVRMNIDISIDLEFFSKFSMIISLLSMADIRVGLHQKRIRPGGIMTHNVYYNHYKHIKDIYFAFNTVLGISYDKKYFESTLSSFKKLYENKLRERFGLNGATPIIAINVNASDLFKFRCWPAENFIEMIQLLLRHYPQNYYILIGGKHDYEYVQGVYDKIENKDGHLINCAGQTNIEELFALIEMSMLVISNDSGPMHIASLYNVNLAAFFGPETPVVFGPINKNSVVFYSKDLYCSPCLCVYDSKKSLYGEECYENSCLTNIKPKEVFEKVEESFLKPIRKT